MRKTIVSTLIVIGAFITAFLAYREISTNENARYMAVHRVEQSRSEFRLAYTLEHTEGPIAIEKWSMQNIDGKSTATYTATDRHGTEAKFNEPIHNYDVTFLFEKLVADGIWELHTRPFRGKTDAVHIVQISQVADKASGSHQFSFSDANYLAVNAGREYHIHLDRNKPVPDLLTLQSTSLADPRYQKIVDDFQQFGSPNFKRTMALAKAKLLKG